MRFPFEIPENKDFDAVGFGTNAVDYLITVPHFPAFASKIELKEYEQAAGGEIATTMAGLSRLGLRTSYVGRFGDDAEGVLGLETLRNDGVDVSHATQIPDARTQIAFILIDEQTGERTVIWKRDAALAYKPSDAPVGMAARGRILHFTPHDAAACLEMARAAKEAGAIVSSDIDNLFDGLTDVLPLVDVFISSSDFPVRLVGITDHEKALREIHQRYGCPVVGMTLGAEGSLLLVNDQFVRTSGFAVPGGCQDTTGAGDAFRVGLLYGLLTGASVADTARMANGVAALKCRAVGARTALPTEAELSTLLKNV